MVTKIESDHHRFQQIVRGRIKSSLRKYMSSPKMLTRRGKDLVSIPVPQVDIPHFRYETRKLGGVGQGEGEPGQPIGGQGPGAGNAPGEHGIEVDITLRELAAILGEELELPRIQPRGARNLSEERARYASIRRVGPRPLRNFKRTFMAALQRQIASGDYDVDDPVIVPFPQDRRFRSWKVERVPQASAVVIHMMDVSGSMGDEQKETVRTAAFWIDTWLRSHYQNVVTRYIIHDAVAHLVDEHAFYHTRESGGTMISSAYELCDKLIDESYSPSEWNLYPFHFSDGDNWEGEDTQQCIRRLRASLLPKVDQFSYGQVESRYGSGDFIDSLRDGFEHDERLVASEITDGSDIYDAIKDFLGKGK